MTSPRHGVINPLFSALRAKPVPFLSFSFFPHCHSTSLSSCFAFSADEDTPPECYSPSEDDEAPSQQAAFQQEEKADGPPRKTYLVAGLYSDDYKTAEYVESASGP